MGRVTLCVGGVELEGVEVDGHLVLTPADFAAVGGQVVALAEEAGPAPARRDVSLAASSCCPSRGRITKWEPRRREWKWERKWAQILAPPAPRKRRDRAAPTPVQDKTRKPKRRHRARGCRAGLDVQDRRPAPRRSPGPAESDRSPFEPGAADAVSPLSSAASAPRPFTSPAGSPSFPPILQPWYCRGLGNGPCVQREPHAAATGFPPWWRPAAGLPPRLRAN